MLHSTTDFPEISVCVCGREREREILIIYRRHGETIKIKKNYINIFHIYDSAIFSVHPSMLEILEVLLSNTNLYFIRLTKLSKLNAQKKHTCPKTSPDAY